MDTISSHFFATEQTYTTILLSLSTVILRSVLKLISIEITAICLVNQLCFERTISFKNPDVNE